MMGMVRLGVKEFFRGMAPDLIRVIPKRAKFHSMTSCKRPRVPSSTPLLSFLTKISALGMKNNLTSTEIATNL